MTKQLNMIKKSIQAVIFLLASSPAYGTHGFGNGGDPLALAFIEKGIELHGFLKTEVDEGVKLAFDIKAFEKTLRTTHVKTVTEELFDTFGHSVIAKYLEQDPLDPSHGLILLRRNDWLQHLLWGDEETLYRFVLHEYLWSIGIDDTNYQVSALVNLPDVSLRPESDGQSFAANKQPPSDKRLWSSYLKIPLTKVPDLRCADLENDLGIALGGVENYGDESLSCALSKNYLRISVTYTSFIKHVLTYHRTDDFETREDCMEDEIRQMEVLRYHLNLHPLVSVCTPSGAKTSLLTISIQPTSR